MRILAAGTFEKANVDLGGGRDTRRVPLLNDKAAGSKYRLSL
jgi:hypothetical protein